MLTQLTPGASYLGHILPTELLMGIGLGLAIVKHVAANHNGSIGLWSQLGTGSTFTLSIPAYGGEGQPPDREMRPMKPHRESQREEELNR